MEPGRIYEIVPDYRLQLLEWRVRVWRTAAWTALSFALVPACVYVLWRIGGGC